MEKYILETQCHIGEPSKAHGTDEAALQADGRSPLTTLWEFWDLAGSYNHPWAGGVLDVIRENIAGIRPTSPAWETFEIRPQLGELKSIDATVPTAARGRSALTIHRRGEAVTVKLTAPPGTKAA